MRVSNEEVRSTIARLIRYSSRGEAEFVNSRMLGALKVARDNTPKATRGRVQQDLGATITKQKFDKRGRVRRSYSYKPTPVVYAVVNARQRRLGLGPFTGDHMKKAAEALIARRIRAIGSLQSGWKRALGVIASAVKSFVAKDGPNVKRPSRAQPAKPGSNQASFEYRLTVDKGAGRGVDPRVIRAWESGLASELAQMNSQLEKKMNEVIKEAGAA